MRETMGKKGKRSNKSAGNGKAKTGTGKARRERAAAVKEIEARIDALIEKLEEEQKDTELFGPLAERNECPLCFVPVSLTDEEDAYNPCCGKRTCSGCLIAHMKATRNRASIQNGSLAYEYCCPFCRSTMMGTAESLGVQRSHIEQAKTRIREKNDIDAMIFLASLYAKGMMGVQEDELASFDLLLRAGEQGSAKALTDIASACYRGTIAKKNVVCAKKLSTIAAKKGWPLAHYQLGVFYKNEKDDVQLQAEHFAYAAKGGHLYSIKICRELCDEGKLSQSEYDSVEQSFLDTKKSEWSEAREDAEKYCPPRTWEMY